MKPDPRLEWLDWGDAITWASIHILGWLSNSVLPPGLGHRLQEKAALDRLHPDQFELV